MSSTLVLDRHVGSLTVSRHGVTLAWLAVLSLALSLVPGAIVATKVAPRAAPAIGPEAVSIYDLPLPAQAVISQSLGEGDRAYHVRGLEATNPAQRLTATFAAAGVTVHADGHRLGLRLVGPAAEPVAAGNRVEYRRGPVTEWYANGPLGLQQGFTIARALSADGLVLPLALSGTLTPAIDARSIAFAASGKPVLGLRGLFAFDADLRPLPTRFDLQGRTLIIRVDDRGARYPVTIDPFFEKAALQASDGLSNDNFSYSIAIDGDTVVVGAPFHDFTPTGNQGAAYVFVRPQTGWAGLMSESAKLTASDAAIGDEFGRSVALDGETVVAGARNHNVGLNPDQGTAYVFVEPPGGWTGSLTESARLVASDGAGSDKLGGAVAVDGDTVVAGAELDDGLVGSNQGAAYVFVKPGGGWAGTVASSAKLTTTEAAVDDFLGNAVAVAGDAVVVGAATHDFPAADQGAAYVYVKPPLGWAGTLVESARLLPTDGATGDVFGASTAIDGDTVVVSATQDDGGAGSAYVFVRPAGGWVGAVAQAAKLIPSDRTSNDQVGVSVAIDGDEVVVGANLDDPPGLPQGSAYVFERPGAGWSGTVGHSAKLIASDGVSPDNFGWSVDISAGTVAVGATGRNSFRGIAYLFGPFCTRDDQTVHIDLAAGGSVTLSRSGNAIHANGEPCQDATVTNVDVISVDGVAAGNESLTVDLSGGPFAPGVETASETGGAEEIEWSTSSVESLTVQGTSGSDVIKFGSAGVNLNGDNDADLTVPDVATSIVYGGLGNDVLTGGGAFGNDPGKWAKPLHLFGEGGMDKLTGGTDDDLLDGGLGTDNIEQFKVADGGDTIVGGTGVDQLSYSSRQAGDPLSVTLDGAANDGSVGEGDNVGVDVENVLLGKDNDFFDATAVPVKNSVQGGAGADELHGGGSADQLRGDGGNDLLFGDGGNDVLNALEAETGTSDTLSGGSGTDTCRVDDSDVITDC